MDDIMRVGQLILTSALVITVIALVCDIVVLTGRRSSVGTVHHEMETKPEASIPPRGRERRLPRGLALYATGFTAIGALLLGGYLVMRSVVSGYSPFANQHEFAVSFVFAILIAYLVAEWSFRVRTLSLVALPVAIALLVYANSLDMAIKPLVPALKNNLMLTLHVLFAILAYGAACVSFAAALLYLLHPYLRIRALPARDVLDAIGYKAGAVTFPLLTMMIVLGSVWAKTAWGSYWNWDPKETAALVTWLIYAGYLHARVTRGWQGARSAWLLILGFAAVLFAYFGNHFFGGLHSYGFGG
ncbi:cytochrome c biogenesis protein CcsA [Schaalia cardiffensis]|uniref:cytochrome c biogenesis protein CcsA n=1 Tax=Schaalia cardiffensis TaxID=181487 RepID=UPI0023F142A1|nr:cytochrome c biogenesis protein CcsA [Schaalia cardiffensis]